jgi:4-hydroxy-4-methyl-2-oxoglutarate aldolase
MGRSTDLPQPREGAAHLPLLTRRIRVTDGPTTDANVARAALLDTPAISDALDKHGINGQCYRIKPVDRGFAMAGRAWTLQYGPAGKPAGTVGDYIEQVEPGAIVVLDNRGRDDMTIWGDILTEVAHSQRIGGTLLNGVNRDSAKCVELGYPVFSLGVYMRTGKDRAQVEATGVPVDVGGVRIAPGDLIRGDCDGVVVIPAQHEDAVLATAEQIQAVEQQIVAAIRKGKSLTDARAEFGYHALQTAASGGE